MNQPHVHVNKETTGVDLSSTVQVKAYLLIGIISQLLYSEQGDGESSAVAPPSLLPPSMGAPMRLSWNK